MVPADIIEQMGIHSIDFNKLYYKYTSCETFLKILESGTVRYSSPDLFEDTYELTFDRFDTGLSDCEYQAVASKYVQKSIELGEWADNTDITSVITKKFFLEKNREMFEQIRKSALIFCTTQSPYSCFMWDKYGIRDTGVCFGMFLERDNDDRDIRVTKKVKYTDEQIQYKQYSTDDLEIMRSIYNWVYCKTTAWKLEDEVRTYIYQNIRYLSRTQLYEDIKFKKHLLLKLYYGRHIRLKDIDRIEKAIKDGGYIIDKYKITTLIDNHLTAIQL
jgi:hypothetical protein